MVTFPALTTSTLPTGATFLDNGNGTGTFNWTPSFTQAGVYNVTFRASDGSLADSQIVTITVHQVNLPPVLAAIGNKSVTEGINLNFGISATDPDGTTPVLTSTALPYGAAFTDNHNGTGSFTWTPTFNRAGIYNVTFYARDDSSAVDSEAIAITVIDAGNQAPILAAIGNKSVTEGINLNFNTSAADPDSTIPVLTTTALPTGATYVDHGNGTGTFNWTPNFTQAGSYNVTFYASDGSLIDSERISINVFESGNQPPVLAAIGNKSTTEGINLNFNISATDPDGTTPSLNTGTLPTGATFADNHNGTGTFSWTPGFTQAGSYNVVFRATDGILIDTELISITVTDAGNQPPVLAAIGSKSTTEGINLNFNISATDPDGTTPALTSSALPSGASLVDHGNGTATFNWTPGFAQAGAYSVTFRASDGTSLDTEVVAITVVDAGNQPPILAAIGSKSTTEGIRLTFNTSATDPDGTTPIMSAGTLPAGASFVDNGNGTGTFTWLPGFTQAGPYSVTFFASDISLKDSEVVTITVVEAGNQAPVLAAIGNRSTTEGINLNFNITATDPDGTIPALTSSSLPTGATFVNNGNGTGTFNWTPGFTQAGSYNVTFRASDGVLIDTELIIITVNDAGNQPPVLAAIGSKSTTEGINLNFNISATDPDGTTPALTSSALPTGASFVDHGNGTATFSWTPNFVQAGAYNVTFRASDGTLIDTEIVAITVTDAGNQPPVLAAIGSKSTTEGVLLTFGTSATDPDGTTPTLSTGALPTGATFVDHGNGTGTFSWTPAFTQAGSYNVIFFASDASSKDSEVVAITVVEAGNQAPILAAIGNKSTTENINLNFVISAMDPDGTTPALTSSSLPTGATFVNNGNGTGTFNWTPGFTQAGSYNVTFRASDGVLIDTELITITVNDAGNQPPVLAAIGSKTTAEGTNLNFNVSASDPDNTISALTTSTLPTGATFVDHGNGTATFNWTPSFIQAGAYNVTFRASDGTSIDSEIVAITVTDAGNQPPVLAVIGSKSTTEGVHLTFGTSATDADGTTPTMSVGTLPTGASFVDNGNGTGTFNWTPAFTQAGLYNVIFFASDASSKDSEVVAITVVEAGNQPPVLATIGSKTTPEGTNLNFNISATDPDGTTPVLTTSTLPTGASFVDNGDGTGTFNWTPSFIQAGAYNVTFRAGDGVLRDTELVTITVTESGNQPPVLAAIGNRSTTENIILNFNISAADPDGTTPSFTTSPLPTGASFVDHNNGTGTFSWTPGFTQAGSYNVTFRASDGLLIDTELITITVIDAGNQPPVLAVIGSKITAEGVRLIFNTSATDPDGTTPTMSAGTLPTGASFVDNGNGTGTFNWTPTFIQSGSYNVIFFASDASSKDSEVVAITVADAGNQPPVLAAIGNRSTTENINLNFIISATDPDGTIPVLTASILPTGATFVNNGNGTGTFNWTPTFTQSGLYNITFRASDGVLIDTELITVTVIDAGNQPPVLAAIGSKSTAEGVSLNFSISATDVDGTIPTLTTSSLPGGATFVDHGNGLGTFNWTPLFTQAGIYTITFRAGDGSLVDTELVTITVTDAGNQPPVLAVIGAKSTTEGVHLTFNTSAIDPDGTIPTMSAGTLPAGATFADNGNGTGSFNWTPTFIQSGSYNVIFFASDASSKDSEVVTITVIEAGNQPPVLAAIGNKSTTEGMNLNFIITASDPDATIPALTTSALPTGATFVNNGNGTGTFNWTPGFTQAGIYNVTFRASDGVQVDTELISITVVEAGNQPPVLAAIGNKSITENINLNFNISASDPDGTIPTFTTSTLPTGATFVDHGNGIGTFNWTPGFTQSGIYNVTFRAGDGSLVDTETVTITVLDSGNQPPVLAAIGSKSTTEGVNLTFNISATDPDATTPSFSTGTLPTGATFTDNGTGTGTFRWTPTFIQSGVYSVVFRASDGALVDTEIVTINVFEAGNQPPVIAPVGPRSTTEGINLAFAVTATDPDGTTPAFTTSALPRGASFVDNGNGSGNFTWTPDFVQSGTFNVSFFATDGVLRDTEAIVITVIDAKNQPPVLAVIGARSTTEGINLNFNTSATDPEGGFPVLSTRTLPSGATYADHHNGTATFSWTPVFNQAGSYNIIFLATDDSLAVDSEIVTVTVINAGNQAPILATVGSKFGAENALLSFGVSAADPDSTIPALSTSTLPTGALFTDNGNGTGGFSWTPSFIQAGTYNITFYASDGALVDSERITVMIADAGNQAPVLAAIGAKTILEGANLNFNVSATDPDGTTPTFNTTTLPTGATFVDHGNGTGTFNWTPNYIQAGTYNVTFRTSDGTLIDTELVTITVTEAGNQVPIVATIGAKSIYENRLLTFGMTATDPDSTTPSLSTSALPAGATFVDNHNGTGTFNWTPSFTQAASYMISFIASDGSLADSENVVITVLNADAPPVLAVIGSKSVSENINLNFNVSATDIDGTTPVLTTSALPTGATFTDHLNGTATFNWTPNFAQSGIYSVTFFARDDSLAVDSEVVSITVGNINQAPILAAIGPRAVNENANLNFAVSATDADGTIPALTTSSLPIGAAFIDNGNGTGAFDWTPTFTQSGLYTITFRASDGVDIDSEIVTITVNNVNRPPTANAGLDQSGVFVNSTVTLDGTASSDPDGPIATYAWTQISGTAVTLAGATTSSPTFVPPTPGSYSFQLVVSDGTVLSLPDTVQIGAINAAPPQVISNLSITLVTDNVVLTWPAVTLDTAGVVTQIAGYIIYRDTLAYFTPSSLDSLTAVGPAVLNFTDNNLGGANVVGDTLHQYFYVVLSYDIYGNRSQISNRVGEYDFQIVTTATTSYNLICIPFENTGITNADQLINAIGRSSVRTVNNYRPTSQSFESRFAAGFGTNFAVAAGGVYQVNAAASTVFSVAGRVPAPGAITYQLVTTATTDYSFLSIPFEHEADFRVAQDVLNHLPGSFNTLNRFVAGSQSYQSRFAAGFGTNFPVKAGKPYQANNARDDVFPR